MHNRGSDALFSHVIFCGAPRSAVCGLCAQDCIINVLNGATDPMRTMTVLQSFIVTYWQINAWAGAPYTLKKV